MAKSKPKETNEKNKAYSGINLGGFLAISFFLIIFYICFSLSTDKQNGNAKEFDTTFQRDRPESIQSILSQDKSAYVFGRWSEPFTDITMKEETSNFIPDIYRRLFTLKKWAFVSLDDRRFFLALAFVQFNYVSSFFIYMVDKQGNDKQKFEYNVVNPFGLGVEFAPNSREGCCKYTSIMDPSHYASLCYDKEKKAYKVEFSATLTSEDGSKRSISSNFYVDSGESLILNFPLDSTMMRPSYVHKGAGWTAYGLAKISDGVTEEDHYLDGLGSLDWTKAMARRNTVWNWVSMSGKLTTTAFYSNDNVEETGRSSVGINFSAKVYDFNGCSQENGVWINQTVYPIGCVEIIAPSSDKGLAKGDWIVRSSTHSPKDDTNPIEAQVDMIFSPRGSREDHTYAGLIINDFVQPFGWFKGEIKIYNKQTGNWIRVQVDRAFGVVEEHIALW